MKHALGLIATLIVFWLALSGHFSPLFLGFGTVSVALVVWLAARMHIVDHEGQVAGLKPRILIYWFWLGGEIIKSALQVARIIWTKPAMVESEMRTTANTRADDLNAVIYANSITLTPGTLAVAVHEHKIVVHALERSSLDALDAGVMRAKVEELHK